MMNMTEFAETPLARSLTEKYGWDAATWKRLAKFAADRRHAADHAGRNPARRSRAVAKVTTDLMSEFGADDALCARITLWHRGQIERMVPGGHPSQKYADLEYAANIIDGVCGLAMLADMMTIDQANSA
jgi:hypothetical protein